MYCSYWVIIDHNYPYSLTIHWLSINYDGLLFIIDALLLGYYFHDTFNIHYSDTLLLAIFTLDVDNIPL